MDVKDIKPRSIEADELPKVIEFLNQSLRPDTEWSIDKEYPQVFQANACPYIRVIEKEGEILSHAAWRPIIVKTEIGMFKVAVIGSVVTNPNHRKQGLSKKIIESVTEEAIACGCEFAILWSDKVKFYEKFGFSLVGEEDTAIIKEKLNVQENSSLKILNTKQVSAEAIHRLYQKHTVSSVRSLEEVKKYLNIPNSNIYTAWQGNDLKAYMIEGKGADFDAYIHEWSGDVPNLKILLNHIMEEQKRQLHWMIPSHSLNLIHDLEKEGVFVHRGYLGMVRILNFPSLATKITRFARGHLRFSDFELHEQDGKYIFGFTNKTYEMNDLKDITKMIFGPNYPSQVPAIDATTAKKLDLVFPLKMWIWGWDSI